MSLYSMFKGKGENGFGYGSTAEEVTSGISLAGKNIVVTGCNSGLGKETARVLAMRGARILGTARTTEKALKACDEIGGNALGFACDLGEPESVRKAIEAIQKSLKKGALKIDAIVCNAGIMALPRLNQAYGYELQFFTNHIGHFILVNGLLKNLAESGRVVMLSSSAHSMAPPGGIDFDNLDGKKGYSPWKAYGQSKMANLLFTKELSRRLERTGKTANAVHPGVIRTNLGRHMNPVANFFFGLIGPLSLKTIAQGSATTCYAVVAPELANVSGHYLADCNIARPRPDANNPELARKLWEKSEQIVAGLG